MGISSKPPKGKREKREVSGMTALIAAKPAKRSALLRLPHRIYFILDFAKNEGMVGPQDTYEAGPNGNEVLGPNPGTNILTTKHIIHIYIYMYLYIVYIWSSIAGHPPRHPMVMGLYSNPLSNPQRHHFGHVVLHLHQWVNLTPPPPPVVGWFGLLGLHQVTSVGKIDMDIDTPSPPVVGGFWLLGSHQVTSVGKIDMDIFYLHCNNDMVYPCNK